jgi:hypothetical protein
MIDKIRLITSVIAGIILFLLTTVIKGLVDMGQLFSILTYGIISLIIIILLWRTFRKPPDIKKTTEPKAIDNSISILYSKINYNINQIEIKIHQKYSLQADTEILHRFKAVNTLVSNTGLIEHYNATRYRVISPIENDIKRCKLILHVAPIDFAVTFLNKNNDEYCKKYIYEKMNLLQKQIKKPIKFNHDLFNIFNTNILGVQVCIITNDNYILFRKRGSNLFLAINRWDVSVSGFCGFEDSNNDDLLFADRTILRETKDEIGEIRANPKGIRFTGLHFNKVSGAMDILAFWKTQITKAELIEMINTKHISEGKKFKTNQRAIEPYVWDSENILPPFGRDQILKYLSSEEIHLNDFEPQSLICTQFALDHYFPNDLPLINLT